MALMEGYLLLGFLVLINVLAPSHGVIASQNSTSLGRSSFPAGFIFGTASSAYQYEGAAREGGRGLSIWDTFTHKYPGKIKGGGNGDVAIDFYHRYKEDIGIMKKMGADAFRFSISWPRVLPRGKISRGVNKEGIAFYNNLINELLSNGVQPFVTLFHWDLPQVLEDEYGGLLSPHVVDDFRDYADLCFREFGDRVKHWITLNEPLGPSDNGHAKGSHAPGRCSPWVSATCTGGDSATEPYLVTHHQLLSHAAAVKVYRDKYQASQKGKIGITLVTNWIVPYSNEIFNKHAAQRSLDFAYGWFMDPLTFGEYPRSMRALVGKRLPRFTEEQSKMVKGSFDFLGLNYYTANYAAHAPSSNTLHASYMTDPQANLTNVRNGVPIGSPTGADWFRVYPKGFTDLLLYTKKRYKSPVIYITENGICEDRKSDLSLKEALSDKIRIDYHHRHLSALLQAIKAGVDVRGYLAWSLFDDFEWDSGYTLRFGLNYIDFKDGLKRYPKQSALWFKKFLQG